MGKRPRLIERGRMLKHQAFLQRIVMYYYLRFVIMHFGHALGT